MNGRGEPMRYQQRVYRELIESARDYFDGRWHDLPVQLRITPLICGSTGCGKSYLVRQVAAELGLPIFAASVSDWMLLGGTRRGAPPTLPRLYRFLDTHERGVIFLDEIEKLGTASGASDWRQFVQLELFGVLDRVISEGVLEDDEGPKYLLSANQLAERFRRGCYIVGAGAWQDLWRDSSMEAIGFGSSPGAAAAPTYEQMATTLREEILNRFSQSILLLPPLSSEQYRETFTELLERVPADVRDALRAPSEESIRAAVTSRKGFRFFEELLARAIRVLRVANTESEVLRDAAGTAEEGYACSLQSAELA